MQNYIIHILKLQQKQGKEENKTDWFFLVQRTKDNKSHNDFSNDSQIQLAQCNLKHFLRCVVNFVVLIVSPTLQHDKFSIKAAI